MLHVPGRFTRRVTRLLGRQPAAAATAARRVARASAVVALVVTVSSFGSTPGHAQSNAFGQSLNLRDLLTNFLLNGITLAEPTEGFSHAAHFTASSSRQFQAFQSVNTEIGRQLSTLPLASSAGGFAYEFDPELGVFQRPTQSFGPIFAERPITVGRGKFNIGYNYAQYTFDTLDEIDMRDGEMNLVFQHQDFRNDGLFEPFFEGDLITGTMFLNIDANIQTLVATYGAGNNFDLGIAIPFVEIDIEASSTAQVQRVATGDGSATHEFINGTDTSTFLQSGHAQGLGDVQLRGKLQLQEGVFALAGGLRVPTGDERNLLGTGTYLGTISLLASVPSPVFAPHLNAGYSLAGGDQSDEITIDLGFDWAADPKLTVAADLTSRFVSDAGTVSVSQEEFRYNANMGAEPQVIESAEFPLLDYEAGSGIELYTASVGVKLNVHGNLLLTLNGAFPLNKQGLRDDFSSLIGIDYSF